jgi:hypothetical protein
MYVPQRRDHQIHTRDVEFAVSIPMTRVRPVSSAQAEARTAEGVGLDALQGVDECSQQFSQYVGVGRCEWISQHLRPMDIVAGRHRVDSSLE